MSRAGEIVMKKTIGVDARRSGMALFAVMAAIAGIAIIGSTAFVLTRTDFGIVANHRYEARAFAFADAGVNYVKTRIEADVLAGNVSLTGNTANIAVNYSAPSGYTFDPVTNIARSSNGTVYFTVVGRDSNAVASVTTAWRRSRAMNYGVFGVAAVDMKASGLSFSYYSTDFAAGVNPTAADSTGDADEATDGLFTTHNGTSIDGDLVLGASADGTPAVWADPGGGAIVSGTSGENVGYIDADPLGAIGGSLAADFITVAGDNDNLSASPSITNPKWTQNKNTLKLTAGNYYFTSLTVGNGAAINIDTSGGPVNIFLTGGATFANSSAINGTGDPTDLRIYSNSSETITVGNSGDFKGLIYAPYAKIDMKNSGNVYGVIWGNDVIIRNSANMFVDLSLLDQFMSSKLSLVSWKENRGG